MDKLLKSILKQLFMILTKQNFLIKKQKCNNEDKSSSKQCFKLTAFECWFIHNIHKETFSTASYGLPQTQTMIMKSQLKLKIIDSANI